MGRSCSSIWSSTVDQTQNQKAIHLKRKQVETLAKKKGYLEDVLTKKVIPPRGSFWHSPSFHTLSLVPMILSHCPIESQLWGTGAAQTWSWGNLSHRLADSVREFGKGYLPCIRPGWISGAPRLKLEMYFSHWNSLTKAVGGLWH